MPAETIELSASRFIKKWNILFPEPPQHATHSGSQYIRTEVFVEANNNLYTRIK